jgi:hypothetical protein
MTITAPSKSRIAKWLAPWLWAPVIPVLTLTTSFGGIRLSATLLLIPLACHLALKHGWKGWWVVALAGLPFLFDIVLKGLGLWSQAHVGVYVVALVLAAWLTGESSRRAALLPATLGLWTCLGLMLLPLIIGLGSAERIRFLPDWLNQISFKADLYPLFFLLVLALGAGGARARPTLLALAGFTAFGALLHALSLPRNAAELFGAELAEIPGLGLVELGGYSLRYQLDTLADFGTVAAYFFAGRHFANLAASDRPALPSKTRGAAIVIALAAFSLGGSLDDRLLQALGISTALIGGYYVLPLAALLAGLYFRFVGILALCFVATAFAGIDIYAGLRAGVGFRVQLETLFVVAAFGLLGIRLRDHLLKCSSNLWSWTWAKIMTAYLLVLASVYPFSEPMDLIGFPTAFFAGVAIAMALGHLRRRSSHFAIELEGGWLALASLIMISYLAYGFGAQLLETAKTVTSLVGQMILAGEVIDDDDLFMLALLVPIGLLSLWTVTSSVEKLVQSAGKMIGDIKDLLSRRSLRLAVALNTSGESATPAKPDGSPAWLLRPLAWFNRALIAAAIATPLVFVASNVLLEYREEVLEDRARPRAADSAYWQEVEEQRKRAEAARAEFVEQLTGAAKIAMADLPDLVVRDRWRGKMVMSDWRQEPGDPDVRWRARANLNPEYGWQDRPLDEAARASLRVEVRIQRRGRFGIWLEDPLEDPPVQEERRRAAALEDAIVAAVTSGLGDE